MTDREDELERIKAFLNQPDAELFLKEITMHLKPSSLLGKTSDETHWLVGRHDAWTLIQQLKDGDWINDELD